MQNFVWDDSIWNEYITCESQYRDTLLGEVAENYVGVINLDDYKPVQHDKVLNLHQRFTETRLDIAV